MICEISVFIFLKVLNYMYEIVPTSTALLSDRMSGLRRD